MIPQSSDEFRIIAHAIDTCGLFPDRLPKMNSELQAVFISNFLFVQKMKLDSLFFMSNTDYLALQSLVDRSHSIMVNEIQPIIYRLAKRNISPIATTQSSYNTTAYYGGKPFGRRSDFDLFAPRRLMSEIAETLGKEGFRQFALDEDWNEVALTEEDIYSFGLQRSVPFAKVVPVALTTDEALELPKEFPPFFVRESGIFCFFSVEFYHSMEPLIGEKEFENSLQSHSNSMVGSIPLPTISPLLSVIANIYRIELGLRDRKKFKCHVLIDILSAIKSGEISRDALTDLALEKFGPKQNILIDVLWDLAMTRTPRQYGSLRLALSELDTCFASVLSGVLGHARRKEYEG